VVNNRDPKAISYPTGKVINPARLADDKLVVFPLGKGFSSSKQD
jgi:hypothetical protein